MDETGAKPKPWGCLKWVGIFFAVIVSIGLLNNLIAYLDPEGAKRRSDEAVDERRAEMAAQEASQRAEMEAEAKEKRSGAHCLSAWDGSNRSTKNQVQDMLREPGSFEHVETRILPLDEQAGEHGLWMTYRARNGFGGMNVEKIYARIDNASCEARVLPGGPGSG